MKYAQKRERETTGKKSEFSHYLYLLFLDQIREQRKKNTFTNQIKVCGNFPPGSSSSLVRQCVRPMREETKKRSLRRHLITRLLPIIKKASERESALLL